MIQRSRELWLIGFFLSKYGNYSEGKRVYPPTELNTLKWKDAYRFFYAIYGIGRTSKSFENSLKNCRDTYDGHMLMSGRKGWRKQNKKPVDLSPLARSIFNQFNHLDRKTVWNEIQKIMLNPEIQMELSPQSKITNHKDLNQIKRKNPNWIREELILALDLYFSLDYGQMHGSNPDVVKLSKDLRALKIHSEIYDKEKFRNVNSVSLKLANLKKMDQNFSGKGMRDGGKLEREIWNEFHRHRETLKKEADLIRKLYLKPIPDKSIHTEGRKSGYKSKFLFDFHKNRESDPLTIKVKKEMVLTNSKVLRCEVCNFDPVSFYGELGNVLMEIHYNKDLKDEPGLETSNMEDFVIICSNCHKVLDKNFGLLNANDLKNLIRKK